VLWWIICEQKKKKMMGGFSVVEKAAAGSGKRENGDGKSYVHSQHRRSKRYSFQTYYLWLLLYVNSKS
jgi:hypothetical protein